MEGTLYGPDFMTESAPNRRDLLTGQALRQQAAAAQDALASAVLGDRSTPQAGPTVRLAIRAMATEFVVLMNPGAPEQIWTASAALDVVAEVERQLTVYRSDSEVSRLNETASERPVGVSRNLFELLAECAELSRLTEGAFDVATHAQIALRQRYRKLETIPNDAEIAQSLARSGMQHVAFDPSATSIAFDRAGVGLNFGAIGKGYALDRCANVLSGRGSGDEHRSAHADESPSVPSFCLSGGHSSVLARGGHNGLEGWPVGIGNPLFTSRRLGTILLKNQAMGTSGSNVQFFRHEGTRYGHILDPRTARPAAGLLSATVIAPTAAMADALSTAFFVLGVEKARELCDNQPLIGALLIPPPDRGGRLTPIVCGLSDECLFLDSEQAELTS